jgi:hypothetical protein
MIQSPPTRLDLEAKVCDLFDVNKIEWNIPLLQELFSDEEVELVLTTPISNSGQGDIQVWRGTKNGLFSVKSAYFI